MAIKAANRLKAYVCCVLYCLVLRSIAGQSIGLIKSPDMSKLRGSPWNL